MRRECKNPHCEYIENEYLNDICPECRMEVKEVREEVFEDNRYMVSKIDGECVAIFMYREDAESYASSNSNYEMTMLLTEDVHEYM